MLGALYPGGREEVARAAAVSSARDAVAAEVIASAAELGNLPAQVFAAEAQSLLGVAIVRRARANRLREASVKAAIQGSQELARYASEAAQEEADEAARVEGSVIRAVRESHDSSIGYMSPEEARLARHKDSMDLMTAGSREKAYSAVLDGLLAESSNFGNDSSDSEDSYGADDEPEEVDLLAADKISLAADVLGGDISLVFGGDVYGGFWDKFKASHKNLKARLRRKQKRLKRAEAKLEALEDSGKGNLLQKWWQMRVNQIEKSISRVKAKLRKLGKSGKKMRRSQKKAEKIEAAEAQVIKETKSSGNEEIEASEPGDREDGDLESGDLDSGDEIDTMLSEAESFGSSCSAVGSLEDAQVDMDLMAAVEVFGLTRPRVRQIRARERALRSAGRRRRRPVRVVVRRRPIRRRLRVPSNVIYPAPPAQRPRRRLALWRPRQDPSAYRERAFRLRHFLASILEPHDHFGGTSTDKIDDEIEDLITPYKGKLIFEIGTLTKLANKHDDLVRSGRSTIDVDTRVRSILEDKGIPGSVLDQLDTLMAKRDSIIREGSANIGADASLQHQAARSLAYNLRRRGYQVMSVSRQNTAQGMDNVLVTSAPQNAIQVAMHQVRQNQRGTPAYTAISRGTAHVVHFVEPRRPFRPQRQTGWFGGAAAPDLGSELLMGFFQNRAAHYGMDAIDVTDDEAFGGFWGKMGDWWKNLWGKTKDRVQTTAVQSKARREARQSTRAEFTPSMKEKRQAWRQVRTRRRQALKDAHKQTTPAVKRARKGWLSKWRERRQAVRSAAKATRSGVPSSASAGLKPSSSSVSYRDVRDPGDPRWAYRQFADGRIVVTAAPPGHDKAVTLKPLSPAGGPYQAIVKAIGPFQNAVAGHYGSGGMGPVESFVAPDAKGQRLQMLARMVDEGVRQFGPASDYVQTLKEEAQSLSVPDDADDGDLPDDDEDILYGMAGGL